MYCITKLVTVSDDVDIVDDVLVVHTSQSA